MYNVCILYIDIRRYMCFYVGVGMLLGYQKTQRPPDHHAARTLLVLSFAVSLSSCLVVYVSSKNTTGAAQCICNIYIYVYVCVCMYVCMQVFLK